MAIRELITLEGVEQVEAQLARINVAGEASVRNFNQLGQSTAGAFTPLTVGARQASQELAAVEQNSIKLGTQMRALRPILASLGVSLGGIGGLARVANTSLALAGAAAGTVAVLGLGKMDEAAQRAKGTLEDLFKSSDKGEQAFKALQESSKLFGATVAELTPGFESLQKALNGVKQSAAGFVALKEEDLPGGGVKNVQQTTDAYNNFIKVLRAGRLTQDDAQKSAKAFFDAFQEGEPITSKALKALPVGTINLLKDALGGAGLKTSEFFARIDSGSVTMDKFVALLARFGAEADKAFETKAIKTFGDEVQKLLAELNSGFQKLTSKGFSDFIVQELTAIRKGITDNNTELGKFIELIDRIDKATEIPGLGKLVQGLREGEPVPLPTPDPRKAEQAGAEAGANFAKGFEGKTGFVDVNNSLEKLGIAGLSSGNKVAQGADQATAALKRTKQAADDASDSLDQQGSGGTAFKGRLNQIPVFVPQLAGQDQGADKAGQQFGQKWIKAVEAEIKAEDIGAALSEKEPVVLIEPKVSVPTEAQEQLVNQFAEAGGQAGQKAREAIQSGLSGIDFSSVLSNVQNLWQQIQSIFNNPIQIQFATNPFLSQQPRELAGGGQVFGPGTTTSDSIMAFLSRKEWVINARAVDYYGSGLFAALNAMRLPRMTSGNHFAQGGQAQGGGSPLNLFIGGQRFEAMASEETVSRIRRAAVNSQIVSIGRKPGFVK